MEFGASFTSLRHGLERVVVGGGGHVEGRRDAGPETLQSVFSLLRYAEANTHVDVDMNDAPSGALRPVTPCQADRGTITLLTDVGDLGKVPQKKQSRLPGKSIRFFSLAGP